MSDPCSVPCQVQDMGTLACQAKCNTNPRCSWCDDNMIAYCKSSPNDPLCGCLNPLYGNPDLGLGYCFSSQCTSGYNTYLTQYMKDHIVNHGCGDFCKNIEQLSPDAQVIIKKTQQYINGCPGSNFNIPFHFTKFQLILLGLFCLILLLLIFKSSSSASK